MPDPVVVTGAASGIGRSVCELLVAEGRNVIGLDLQAVDAVGVRVLGCDLSDPAAIEAAIEALDDQLGGLVNCAGVPGTHPPQRVLAVNLLAARRLSEALAGRVVSGGAVVNVASVAANRSDRSEDEVAAVLAADDAGALEWLARIGLDGPAAYDFSKKALVALTLVHSARWLGAGVRCVSVSPGPTVTPILSDFEASMGADRLAAAAEAAGGHAHPEDVAAVVAFLLSPAARWVNGIDLRVDGGVIGSRLAPRVPSPGRR